MIFIAISFIDIHCYCYTIYNQEYPRITNYNQE